MNWRAFPWDFVPATIALALAWADKPALAGIFMCLAWIISGDRTK
jgi:hypothetical protein